MKRIVSIIFVFYSFLSIDAQERFFLTSDSVNLYINVRGKGIPCLYIHGGPGADSYFLEKLAGDYLEQHFQMIYLDQRGSGRSSSPKDNNFTMDRMIKDFEEIRKSLGIDSWITLGHSFGGILQIGYIQRNSSVIDGMIMINCTLNIPESFNKSWFPKACEFLDQSDCKYYLDESVSLKKRLDSLIVQLIQKDIIWKMSFSSLNDNQELNAVYSNRTAPNNNDFFSVAFAGDYLNNYQKETVSISKPVLFFYGEKDWCVGPEHYKNINFPNMILWKSSSEHMMPFLKNKPELENAINNYITKYNF